MYLLIAIAILWLLSSVLGKVQHTLARTVRHKEGLPGARTDDTQRNRQFSGCVTTRNWLLSYWYSLTLYGSVKGWYSLMSIGISQVIPGTAYCVLHKLHAGTMQIPCIYCHSGAERGKSQLQVSLQRTCVWNRHKYVRKGPETGTAEIAKFIKRWITILTKEHTDQILSLSNGSASIIFPDLAYFNHAQHVVVGKSCLSDMSRSGAGQHDCSGSVLTTYNGMVYQLSPVLLRWKWKVTLTTTISTNNYLLNTVRICWQFKLSVIRMCVCHY